MAMVPGERDGKPVKIIIEAETSYRFDP